MAVEHKPRNSLFWKGPEPVLQQARQQPGWKQFHRACGKQGLFFDDIDPVGKSKTYEATAFRLKGDTKFVVAKTTGIGPIAAVLATFEAAVKAGFAVDPAHANLLREGPPPAADDEFDGLIGAPEPVDDDFEGLL